MSNNNLLSGRVNRQYIGGRYIPKFYQNSEDGSTLWEANVVYEPLVYVTLANGNMYLSKKQVPAIIGSPAANMEYWLFVSSYNGYIERLQEEINNIIETLETAENNIEDIQTSLTYTFANVMDYGAKADGTTDDREAFVNALATGKPVYAPEGTYRISSAITVNAGVHVFGDGQGKTILKFDNQTDPQKYLFQNYTEASKQGAIFRDFTIDVNTYEQDPKKFHGGIFLQAFTDILIDNIEVYHTSEGGNAVTLWGCSRGTVSNCFMHHLYGTGIYVCESSSKINIVNNKVIDSIVTSGCIDCWQSNNIVIEGNYVESQNNLTFGMNIDTCRQLIIANNNCNASNTGIAVFSSSEMTIIGNRCRNSSFAGIELQKNTSGNPCSIITIADNDCLYNGEFGIVDSSESQFTKIHNNRIGETQKHGIYCVNNSLCDIKGNTVRNSGLSTANTFADIYIAGTGQYPSINDNVMYSANAAANVYTESGVGGVMCNNNNCLATGGTYNINIVGTASAIVENNRGTTNIA